MRNLLQLAALLTILAGTPAVLRAQISNPNDLVVGPPKPHNNTHPHTHQPGLGNLQWLWTYAQPVPGGNPVALREDERFLTMLDAAFRQPQAFWGKQVPLSAVVPRFVARYSTITTRDNRYYTLDGCVPSFCAAHGMLWIDLGQPDPLLVFAAVDWTTEAHTTDEPTADYNLWLFPSRQLSADALPFALTSAISDWDARLASAHRGVPHIAHAILVEPDGQPFPLNPKLAGANALPPQPDTITPSSE